MRQRLSAARVGHLVTVRADATPHVVPCCFALDGEVLYTAIDDIKTKSTLALRRMVNIAVHPATSLLVDHYDDADWTALWWIRVDGQARVVEAGATRDVALDLLAAKYDQYRRQPPPGAVIAIAVTRWSAWP